MSTGRFRRTFSCGCINREFPPNVRHNGFGTPEYQAWNNMRARCKSTNKRYKKWYFDRGIRVCKEWKDDFMAFRQHIGARPSEDMSVDRIDNDRGYEPGNVRWATQKQQIHNSRVMKNG